MIIIIIGIIITIMIMKIIIIIIIIMITTSFISQGQHSQMQDLILILHLVHSHDLKNMEMS